MIKRDNMIIEHDLELVVDDGTVLRYDVYRPDDDKQYPAIVTYGPYGKGMHFTQNYQAFWDRIRTCYPEILENTSAKYLNWENIDPEKWIPEGYASVRFDSRGSGRSEGEINCWSEREAEDYCQCIEHIASLPWCDGNIGGLGISYYATMQWAAAAKRPPHLKAIIPFEGFNDFYREAARHGGVLHDMLALWYPRQVKTLQHGLGYNGMIGALTGDWLCGPEMLSEEELEKKRIDFISEFGKEELVDADVYNERKIDLSKIEIPVLSCGNWGGNALHLRGNIEGFLNVPSKDKFLEIHGLEHFTEFYTDYGRKMQQAFLDHYLKGLDTWHQAPVHLRLRNVDGSFVDVEEQEWPIARTEWTKYYFSAEGRFSKDPNADYELSFSADSEGLDFISEPLEEQLEITGPIAAKIYAASDTTDADIFLTMRVIDPSGTDVTFVAASDPHGVVATGWLRASHRKLDPEKSTFFRPYHTHDEVIPLVPGEKTELDVEVWPTSVIIPKGYRFGFSVSSKDFELKDERLWTKNAYGAPWKGQGAYSHNMEKKPASLLGTTTIISKGEERPYILLPVIPKR
ncbi:MAG: CocE/NonD family hydrolase [Lachnospiraceae bacterium]|nr:CocE/NonD family hydrolase [Lachnospiraceae bacterium]